MLQIEAISDLEIVPAPLQVLIPDNQTTRFQLFQCSGELNLNDCVQNSDREEAKLKHFAYLASAREKNTSIALTPEYSCPWQVVETLVNDQKYQPKIGSLLILGCESIMPEELASLRERTDENIRWHSETIDSTGNQLFFSAAVYIFHLHDSTEEDVKLCGLIQFKTHDMGGTPFERDNLIKGSVVYKISNPGTQCSGIVKLAT